jgi:hypothetical protein
MDESPPCGRRQELTLREKEQLAPRVPEEKKKKRLTPYEVLL